MLRCRDRLLAGAAVITAFVFLALAIIANGLSKPLGHDEHMYCTAGALVGAGKVIYRDFSYVSQWPLHPLLLAGIYRLLDTDHYLLVGRMVSCACDILTAALIVLVYLRLLGKGRMAFFLGLAAASIYVFNPAVDYSNGLAWNHDVVAACVMLAFWFVLKSDGPLSAAVAGAALSAAAFMRPTTALPLLLFACLPAFSSRPARSRRLKRFLVPFVLGAIVAAVWPLAVIASSWRAFLINAFVVPDLNGSFLREIGMVHDKADVLLYYLASPPYTAGLAAAVYLWIKGFNRGSAASCGREITALAAILPVCFFAVAFVPPTMWRQYMAAPVPFFVAGMAVPLARMRESESAFTRACLILAACAVLTVAANTKALSRIQAIARPAKWIPTQVHNTAAAIVAGRTASGPVLTLAPLYALEGGCDIYDELAAGPFMYRVADRLTAGQRAIAKAVGYTTLGKTIDAMSPSVVIMGTEPAFIERPLYQVISTEGWEKATCGPLTVYFRRQ